MLIVDAVDNQLDSWHQGVIRKISAKFVCLIQRTYSVELRLGVGQTIATNDFSFGEESPGSIGQSAR